MHEIDSSLANAYASHVLRGSPLHLHFTSVVASRHLVTDRSFDLNLVRGFTRLRHIYWVFIKAGERESAVVKGPNNTAFTTAADSYTWQITIGSRKWPERACTGVAQSFMRPRQAVAAFYGTSGLAITPSHVNTPHFINGVDLEKVGHQGASHSGCPRRTATLCS